jgi:hypothetical protein
MRSRLDSVWTVVKIPSVTFQCCTVEDSSKKTVMLKERFGKPQTCPGTQKMHFIIPASKNLILRELFSEATIFNSTHIVHLQD